MRLAVREAAHMFAVSERTIERWIRDDGMPHERVQGRLRFQRADLIDWANRHGVRVAAHAPASQRPGVAAVSLEGALLRGGVHLDVPAADREDALRAVVARMPIADDGDRDLVFEVLLARENAGTTGIGDGIAIPHVRNPLVLDVDGPSVTLCRLARPVDFHAIDGKPVQTVFAIVAPTARAHLELLARLAAVLHDVELRRALVAPSAETSSDDLLAAVRAAEGRLGDRPSEPPADAADDGADEERGA